MRSTCYYFSIGGIIPTGFNFTELHVLTPATHSYALLPFTDKGIENISIGTRNCCSITSKNVLSRGPANDWFEALHPYLLYSSRIRRWFVDTVFVQHRERFCEYLLESPSAEVKLAISVKRRNSKLLVAINASYESHIL